MSMVRRQVRKVLVANRGEIAVRVFRTCKELGIHTVAVFSDADRAAQHVLMADEACYIGASPSRESYLVIDKIIQAAKATEADAIHPGYGFLSENELFSRRVEDEGLIFIGPPSEAIRLMGDKIQARQVVSAAGVPVVPGTDRPIQKEEDALSFAEEYGFPVLIKAAAGGGGKGMRVVRKAEEFSSAFRSAQSEAQSAFGDGRVYLEKYLDHPRHVEFQVLADGYGNTIHLGERECSIQRRHQKVIEESPSTIVDDSLRVTMGEIAVVAARSCHYINAGTVEFLVDQNRNFYFLEMNTRLQVEHGVTEMRTGIDLVGEQLQISMGEPLAMTQEDVKFTGHAIECRIYAEDPYNDYLPSTGRILHLRPSQGFGIRDDRGVDAGGEVSVFYDPLISKLMVWGRSRTEAIRRMVRALREYEILGVDTNISLNMAVLQHPRFVKGDFDTHFLDELVLRPQASDMTAYEESVAVAMAAMLHAGHEQKGSLLPASGHGHSSLETGVGDLPPARERWKSTRTRNMRGSM